MNLNVKVIMLNVGRLKGSRHLKGLWNLPMGHPRAINVSCLIFPDSP